MELDFQPIQDFLGHAQISQGVVFELVLVQTKEKQCQLGDGSVGRLLNYLEGEE